MVCLTIVVLAGGVGAWHWRSQIKVLLSPYGINSHHLVLTPAQPLCDDANKTMNPIVAENTCAGASSWRQTLPLGPSNAIEAFAAPSSVNIGQTVRLYVSTTARTYSFSIYRVGWYQGLGARLLYSSPLIHGIAQPAPTVDPVTRAASCANWRDPVSLAIPTHWVSGVYVVKLVTSTHFMRYTLFVVRDDASHAPILFQLALATYQAYNELGGRSLYGGADTKAYDLSERSYAVSFDRPLAGAGLGLLPRFEGPLIMFLERAGYDVSYMTDIDLVLHPQPITQHRLLVIGGHDEYWSAGMRQVATAARDHGVSLAFFSSNSVYWQTRLADSPLGPDRLVFCYKRANMDPYSLTNQSQVTATWAGRPVNQPQNSLLGALYNGIPVQPEPLVLAPGVAPYLTDTGLRVGSALPGLVFGEIDTYVNNGAQPKHVVILGRSTVHILMRGKLVTRVSDATLYTAPSGAMVFDSGTFEWYLGLGVKWTTPIAVTGSEPGESSVVVPVTYGTAQLTANILDAMLAAAHPIV